MTLICSNRTRRPAGFTLTEILVAIAIIVVILAMAVPAFNYITGTRSTAAAGNTVAAMLSMARALSLGDATRETSDPLFSPSYVGVAFFVNPENGRTTMAFVQRAGVTNDSDPLDNYKTYMPNFPYSEGQRVVFITRDNEEGQKPMVRLYERTDQNPGATNAPPPLSGPPFSNANWSQVIQQQLELVPDADFTVLPPGVGVQLINDTRGSSTNPDRYVRTGVIMFDPQGRLDSVRYAIRADSALGRAMGLLDDIDPNQGIYTQFGFVLYDLEDFRNATSSGGPSSEGDWTFVVPHLEAPSSQAAEIAEEQWLDENTTPRMINRATGTLQAGE
jgi:prepilin-type N-terminal cleavage/methylation domain-containing protein